MLSDNYVDLKWGELINSGFESTPTDSGCNPFSNNSSVVRAAIKKFCAKCFFLLNPIFFMGARNHDDPWSVKALPGIRALSCLAAFHSERGFDLPAVAQT